MSPTIEHLRATLDDVADRHEAPDPHAVLAGAHARAGELGRRRTTGRWAAAAAAVVAIGGASLLITDLDGDSQGEVAPAEPDESYTEGYGIIDGELQPYTADGLRMVDQFEIENGENLQVEVDSSSQLYAVAVCSSDVAGRSQPAVTILTRTRRVGVTCADENRDSPTLPVTSLPTEAPESDGVYGAQPDDEIGPVSIVFYAEEEWRDYPFPSTEASSFPDTSNIVLDADTPLSSDTSLDWLMPSGERQRLHTIVVPVADLPLEISAQLNGPGQVLVAVDGAVLTNDEEELGRLRAPTAGPWDAALPGVRQGYLHSFGQPEEWGFQVDRNWLEDGGADLSDDQVTVSVHAVGFPDATSWRVTVGTSADASSADGNTGVRKRLEPMTESGFAEYAFGHRLVEAYEVPTDGVARSVGIDSTRAETLTWVPQCPDTIERDARGLQPDIGSLDLAGSVSTFTCLSGVNFIDAVNPDETAPGNAEGAVTLAMRPAEGVASRQVGVYEPVPFEDFPFDESEPLPLFSELPAPEDGESAAGDGFVYRQTGRITLADLDGATTIEVPVTRWTEFYVTTEGVGRFWLKSTDLDEGALTSGGSSAINFGGTLGRDEWWTSWTDQRTRWPIIAQTDSGRDPERVVLRVEGYEEGSFELRVVGQFPEDEQP